MRFEGEGIVKMPELSGPPVRWSHAPRSFILSWILCPLLSHSLPTKLLPKTKDPRPRPRYDWSCCVEYQFISDCRRWRTYSACCYYRLQIREREGGGVVGMFLSLFILNFGTWTLMASSVLSNCDWKMIIIVSTIIHNRRSCVPGTSAVSSFRNFSLSNTVPPSRKTLPLRPFSLEPLRLPRNMA